MIPTFLALFIVIVLAYFYRKTFIAIETRIFVICFILVLNAFLLYIAKGFGLGQGFLLGGIFSLFNGPILLYMIRGRQRELFLHIYCAIILMVTYLIFYLSYYHQSVIDLRQINYVSIITLGVINVLYVIYGFIILSNISTSFSFRLIAIFYVISQFVSASIGFYYIFFDKILVNNISVYQIHIYVVLSITAIVFCFNNFWNKPIIESLDSKLIDTKVTQQVIDTLESSDISNIEPITSDLKIIEIDSVIDAFDIQTIDQSDVQQLLWERIIESEMFLSNTLTLQEVSQEIGVSLDTLRSYFSKTQAKTFRQYINRLRIEYSVSVIHEKNKNVTVEELAAICGFNTRLSYYRAFVNVYGFPPSEFLSSN